MTKRGDWMAYCGICKRKVSRDTLAYRRFQGATGPRQNRLVSAAYEATNWTSDVFVDYQCRGMHPQNRYSEYDDSTQPHTATIRQGAPRFSGAGYARSTTGVDVAAQTDVTLSAYVGQHETSTAGERTFSLGVCVAVTGGEEQTLLTHARVNGDRRLVATIPVADLTPTQAVNLGIVIRQTTAGVWWFEHAQMEFASKVGDVAPAGVVETVATVSISMVAACPACRETMPNDPLGETYVQDASRNIPPIPDVEVD
jgi:hypothetical protein